MRRRSNTRWPTDWKERRSWRFQPWPQDYSKPGGAGVGAAANQLDLRRRGPALLEDDSLAQLFQRFRRRAPAHDQLVLLVDVVARVLEAEAELAVIGQQDQATAVEVETPDGMKALRRRPVAHQGRDQGSMAPVTDGGEVPGGLVDSQVAMLRESRLHLGSIDGDDVLARHHQQAAGRRPGCRSL